MRAGVNYGGTHIVNVSLEGPIAGATGIASAEVEADLVRADQAEPVSRAASVAWYFDNMNGLQGGEPLQNLAREFRALVIGAQRDSRKINELLAPLAGRFEQGRKALAEAYDALALQNTIIKPLLDDGRMAATVLEFEMVRQPNGQAVWRQVEESAFTLYRAILKLYRYRDQLEADTREKLEEIARNARDVFLQAFLLLERQPSYVATRGWVQSARALLSSLR